MGGARARSPHRSLFPRSTRKSAFSSSNEARGDHSPFGTLLRRDASRRRGVPLVHTRSGRPRQREVSAGRATAAARQTAL